MFTARDTSHVLIVSIFRSVSLYIKRHSLCIIFFFFSSRRRHTRLTCDWSSDVCSSDLAVCGPGRARCDDCIRDGEYREQQCRGHQNPPATAGWRSIHDQASVHLLLLALLSPGACTGTRIWRVSGRSDDQPQVRLGPVNQTVSVPSALKTSPLPSKVPTVSTRSFGSCVALPAGAAAATPRKPMVGRTS